MTIKRSCRYRIITRALNAENRARELVSELKLAEDQVFVEIRQDTRGVLGLHALRRGKSTSETLELIYQ